MDEQNFTVKVKHIGGETRLWPATMVTFYPASARSGDANSAGMDTSEYRKRDTVAFDKTDGVECTLDSGTVYVMNASGKTVDTFHLDGIYGGSA